MLYTYKANGAKIRSSELWVRASGFWGPTLPDWQLPQKVNVMA